MKHSLWLLLAFALVTCALSGCHPRQVTTVPPGVDCFHTPEGDTSARLANRPIPAGFFAPDSEPFAEEICFRGNPDNPLDTCVQRLDEMKFDDNGQASSRIELTHLDLESCEPIVVRINGKETVWDVTNSISKVEPSSGRMQVTRENDRGGVFEAEIGVLSRLTFTPRDPDLEVKVFDMGELQMEPERLATTEPVPWVHSTDLELRFDPERGYRPDNNFIPAVQTADGVDTPVGFQHASTTWGHFTLLLEEEPGPGP